MVFFWQDPIGTSEEPLKNEKNKENTLENQAGKTAFQLSRK